MWIAQKIFGSVCILCASWLTGHELEHRQKLRCGVLKELEELFLYLEKEMTFHRTPMEEAFLGAAEGHTGPVKGMLQQIAGSVARRDGTMFQAIWEEAAASWIPQGLLNAEEYQIVCGAGSALGGTDTVMQRVLLERQAARFGDLAQRAAAGCEEKGRLYRRLSALAGVFLVIVLL